MASDCFNESKGGSENRVDRPSAQRLTKARSPAMSREMGFRNPELWMMGRNLKSSKLVVTSVSCMSVSIQVGTLV
jgi:hypothetical protein